MKSFSFVLATFIFSLAMFSCNQLDVEVETDFEFEVGTEKGQTATKARVIRVIDGDTVEVEFRSGEKDKVRLLAVDTPETRQANKLGEYGDITDIACLKDWGEKATSFAEKKLDGESVHLVSEDSQLRDYYDRLLAYVHMEDGEDFNQLLVEKGFARVYEEGDSDRETVYIAHQVQAIKERIGLWGCLAE